jgi:hypothetical protein
MSELGCLRNKRYRDIKVTKQLKINNSLNAETVKSPSSTNEITTNYTNDLNIENLEVETLVKPNSLEGNKINLKTNLPIFDLNGATEIDVGSNSTFIIKTNYIYNAYNESGVRIKLTGTEIDKSKRSIIDVNLLQYDPVVKTQNTLIAQEHELYYFRRPDGNYEWPLVKNSWEAEFFAEIYWSGSVPGGLTYISHPPVLIRAIDGVNYYTSGVWIDIVGGIVFSGTPPTSITIGDFTNPVWINAATQLPGIPMVYGSFDGEFTDSDYEIIIKNMDNEARVSGTLLISVNITDLKII